MKQPKYCDYCGDIGDYHWPGCPQAEVERVNTQSVTHPILAKAVVYPPQPERIIRPAEHADLILLRVFS